MMIIDIFDLLNHIIRYPSMIPSNARSLCNQKPITPTLYYKYKIYLIIHTSHSIIQSYNKERGCNKDNHRTPCKALEATPSVLDR
jgi:hypothetical protein